MSTKNIVLWWITVDSHLSVCLSIWPIGIESECINCGRCKVLLPPGSVGKFLWRVSCSFFYLLHFEWGWSLLKVTQCGSHGNPPSSLCLLLLFFEIHFFCGCLILGKMLTWWGSWEAGLSVDWSADTQLPYRLGIYCLSSEGYGGMGGGETSESYLAIIIENNST